MQYFWLGCCLCALIVSDNHPQLTLKKIPSCPGCSWWGVIEVTKFISTEVKRAVTGDPWIEIPLFPSLSLGNKTKEKAAAGHCNVYPQTVHFLAYSSQYLFFIQGYFVLLWYFLWPDLREECQPLLNVYYTSRFMCVWINPASLQSISVSHISAILKISAVKKTLLHSLPKASGSWPSWHGMNPAQCQLTSWGHLHVPSPVISSAGRCARSNSQGLCFRNTNGWGYTTCHTLATLCFNEELFSDSTRETVGVSTSRNVGEWNLKQNLAACKLFIT